MDFITLSHENDLPFLSVLYRFPQQGVLRDGTPLAMKKLFPRNSTKAMIEFHYEIKAIDGILHINLLGLLGDYTQGQDCLLIYEFMPKRSLDINLFAKLILKS